MPQRIQGPGDLIPSLAASLLSAGWPDFPLRGITAPAFFFTLFSFSSLAGDEPAAAAAAPLLPSAAAGEADEGFAAVWVGCDLDFDGAEEGIDCWEALAAAEAAEGAEGGGSGDAPDEAADKDAPPPPAAAAAAASDAAVPAFFFLAFFFSFSWRWLTTDTESIKVLAVMLLATLLVSSF